MDPIDESENSLRRYVMGFGPYRGRSLEQIAEAPGGLKYLRNTPKWIPQRYTSAIREGQAKVAEFLALPSIQRARAEQDNRDRQFYRHRAIRKMQDRDNQSEQMSNWGAV